jgi:hypothetical protein
MMLQAHREAKEVNELLAKENTETTKRLATVETRLKEQNYEHKMRFQDYKKELEIDYKKEMEQMRKEMQTEHQQEISKMKTDMQMIIASMEYRLGVACAHIGHSSDANTENTESPEKKRQDSKVTPTKPPYGAPYGMAPPYAMPPPPWYIAHQTNLQDITGTLNFQNSNPSGSHEAQQAPRDNSKEPQQEATSSTGGSTAP